MIDRRVVAAADGPEERVAEHLALEGRRAVGRNQESRRAVVLLDRVIEDGQVHQRHALDPEDGVGQERVIVEVDRHRPGDDFPAGCRLDAGGEAAVLDLVFLGPELGQRFSPEVGVGLLAAEHAAVGALALVTEDRRAPRVVERAGARPGVELHAIGGDPIAARYVDDVALRGDHVLLLESLGEVREKLHVVADDAGRILHRPVEAGVVLQFLAARPRRHTSSCTRTARPVRTPSRDSGP